MAFGNCSREAPVALFVFLRSGLKFRRTALLASSALVGIALMPSAAQAQSVWGGTGSSTITTDYNLGTNWSGAVAPIAAGQSAQFGSTGNASVNVTAAIAPDAWTFLANSQSYTVTGAAVTFGGAGLTNNASAGQSISVANSLSGAGGVFQNGASSLLLSGANTYTGGTTVSAGQLTLGASTALGSTANAVTLNGGTLDLNGLTVTQNGGLTLSGATLQNGTFSSSGGFNMQSGTVNAILAGSGALAKTTSGLVILGAANSYTGGTTISGGTVRIDNAAALSVGTVTIGGATLQAGTALTLANNIALTSDTTFDSNGHAFAMFGTVSGTGNFTKAGLGNMTLSGANSWTGSTTLNAGQLTLGTSTSLGNTGNSVTLNGGALDLNGLNITQNGGLTLSGATLQNGTFNSSGAFNLQAGTVNAALAGAGAVSKTTGGLVILGAANSYTGGTTISNGTVRIDNAAALGVGTVNIGGATLQAGTALTLANNIALTSDTTFDSNGNAFSLSGIVSGTGNFTKTGLGNMTLSGANSWTGSTTLNAGQLTLGTSTSLGNTGNSVTLNGGTLDLNGFSVTQNGGLTLAGATLQNGTFNSSGAFNLQAGTVNATLAGSGAVAKTTAGVVILGAANTFTGGSTISAGTLQLGNAGALGNNANITAISGGTLDLGGLTATQAVLSQSGGTVQNGTINVGTYQLTGGTLAGTATVSAATAFDLQAGTVNGVLAGAGPLTKTTAGTVTLNGANTYTGVTTVNGGTFSVNGSTAVSTTTVNAGGTLGGNGTVGDTTINGGALAPGNSIGLLTVQGNLVFTAASSYLVEVSPANADRVNVTGTATLGGATVSASFAAGSYVSKQYTIVNATGGVIGTFGAQANTNLPVNFASNLSYDANNAYLNLTLSFTPVTPGQTAPVYVPLNVNQQNVGTSLVNYFNRTGGIPLVFGTLTPVGLTQASGEIATATQQATFDAMNLFLGVLTDPFTAGREAGQGMVTGYTGEALSYATKRGAGDALDAIYRKAPLTPRFAEHWNVWAAGFGGQRTTDGNATLGSSNATARIGAVAVGADYWLSPRTVAGFALAGGGTNFSVNGLGSGQSDLFQAGGFVRHMAASAYLTAAAAYGWQDTTTDRGVAIAGFDRLRARFNAHAYSGRIEGGNRYGLPWFGGVGVTPYAAAQVTAFELPSYAENVAGGVNTFALNDAGKTVTATRSELGLRSDKSYAVADALLTLRGRAAWAHDFNTDRNVQATFQSLPGATFVVNGAALARDAALTTTSAEVSFVSGISLAATFEGEFSNVTRSYAGKGVARYAW
jgi:autotransporter-associated beta strand protein